MPKRGESIPARRQTGPRKRRLSRAEREARTQRYIVAGLVVIVAISITLLVAAIVYEQIVIPNQPIIVIGDWTITTREFQSYVRLARLQTINQLAPIIQQFGPDALRDPNLPFYNQYMQLSSPISMGQQVIDQLIEQELVHGDALSGIDTRQLSINEAQRATREDRLVGRDRTLRTNGHIQAAVRRAFDRLEEEVALNIRSL